MTSLFRSRETDAEALAHKLPDVLLPVGLHTKSVAALTFTRRIPKRQRVTLTPPSPRCNRRLSAWFHLSELVFFSSDSFCNFFHTSLLHESASVSNSITVVILPPQSTNSPPNAVQHTCQFSSCSETRIFRSPLRMRKTKMCEQTASLGYFSNP